jgi:PAT family beta-lactamase induction signal transducer AmpG
MQLFLGLLFAHNLFAAAQDVGTDALAVELLDERERGTANSVMWASKHAGVAVGGAGLTWVSVALGWRWIFPIMAAVILAIAILPTMVREPPRPAGAPASVARFGPIDWSIHIVVGLALFGAWPVYRWGGITSTIWYLIVLGIAGAAARMFLPGATPLRNRVIATTMRSFTLRATFFGLLLFSTAPAAGGLLGPLFVPLLKNRMGYSDGEIGTLNGIISGAASVAGALAGGILSDRIGRRRAIVLFSLITVGVYFAFGGLPGLWHARAFVYGYVIVIALAEGMLQATFLSLGMDLSNPAVGGTQFTTYMSAQNLKYSWASKLGGIAATVPVPMMFALAAALQAAALLLLPLVNPEEAKRAFRKDEEVKGREVAV